MDLLYPDKFRFAGLSTSNNKSSGNDDDKANCKILEIYWVLIENTPRWRQSWLRQLYSGEGEVDKIAERLVDPE